MTLPDYRIRFPSNKINFPEEVYGGSDDGQEINEFPQPGQARYDFMRLAIIGLLANQSSTEEPINYKLGTLWYNLNDEFLKFYDGENFDEIAKAIRIGDMSLHDWSELVQDTVGRITEPATFSGISNANHVVEINVPEDALQAASYENNHPILYINGLLIDLRLTSFNTERNKVLLLNNDVGSVELMRNDKYTVSIERVDKVIPETVIAS